MGVDFQVVVVGAGPAGTLAGLSLAEKGVKVLLLDKSAHPREKVCGDAIIPDAIRCLGRHALLDRVRAAGHPLGFLSLFSPNHTELRVPGDFITVKRSVLDRLLLDAAVAAGARFENARAAAIANGPDSVSVAVQGGRTYAAGFAIVATGADTTLLRPLGMVSQARPSAVASRCYVRSADGPDRLVVTFDKSVIPGYGWIFPLGNSEYNVGVGGFTGYPNRSVGNHRVLFRKFVEGFDLAKRLYDARLWVSPLKSAPLRCGLQGTRLVSGRVLAAGEAAGSTFHHTGEGIGKAMETGEMAGLVCAEAAARNDPKELGRYEAWIAEEVRPKYLGYKIAEKSLASAFLTDFLAGRVARSPYLQEVFRKILCEESNPRDIFSMTGFLRSLWS